MRKHWVLSCLLSASVLGSTAAGFPGFGNNQSGGQPSAQQLAAMHGVGMQPPKQSWTDKFTGMFKPKSKQATPPVAAAGNPALDPISLGFASGPPNADLYLSMAKMSDQGGNTAHARSMYHRALSMQPNHLDGMLALARLEDREGQLDAALHYYKQAVHYHPQSPKALNDLALCFARRNQVAEALPPLEQAIRIEPAKQLYRNNIAKVLIELNQLDGALYHLSAAHPPAVAQYNMGVLLHQRGRDQEAASYLTAALQTDPSLTSAQSLMAQLTAGTQQFAQAAPPINSPVMNGQVLPTPPSTPYPAAGSVSASPQFKTVPAQTAQRPVGYAPNLAAPVR